MSGRAGNTRARVALAAVTVVLASCGGATHSAERAGRYPVRILAASFPHSQRLGERSTFQVTVRNTGHDPIPDLAVTLHGLGERAGDDPHGTLWVTDVPPRGGVTAFADTWTAGSLQPGASATLRWVVTAVAPGTRMLSYEIAAGLGGRARAVLGDGRTPRGAIVVRVTDRAPKARVDPRTGDVLREKTLPGE